MKHLVCVFCIISSISLFGQASVGSISPYTIRGNIGIQKPISSAKFHQSFAGLYEGNVSFNVRLGGNFSAGLGYQSTHFKNNQFLRYTYFNASIPYNTALILNSAFVRLGYDHFFKKDAFVGYALNGGLTFANYNNVNQDSSILNQPFIGTRFTSPYVQPEISVNFRMEQRLAFSVFFSYTTMFYKYDPRAPRFAHFREIQVKRNDYIMSYFNFGFGFTVLLGS